MDVRCPRCKTLFELQTQESGEYQHVKCGFCGHIFHPTESHDASPLRLSSAFESPYVTHHTPNSQEPRRKWLLRIADNGDVLSFDDMTLLQQWIAQGRVVRNDELSKSGRSWKALGSIDSLKPLFDAADGIRRFHAAISGTHSALTRPEQDPPPETETNAFADPPSSETKPDWFDPDAPGKVSSYISANLPIPSELQPISANAETDPEDDSNATRNIDLADVPLPIQPTQDSPTHMAAQPSSNSRTKTLLYSAIAVTAVLVCVFAYFVYQQNQTTVLNQPPSNTATPSPKEPEKTPTEDPKPQNPDPQDPTPTNSIKTPEDPSNTTAPTPPSDPPKEPEKTPEEPEKTPEEPEKTPTEDPKDPPSTDADQLLQQAHTARQNGHAERAIELFTKATKTYPKHPGGHAGLGWVYLSQNQNPRAVLAFRTALGVDPKHEDAVFGLAKALHQAKNLNKAARAYDRYIKLFPSGQHVIPARQALSKLRGG